MTQAPEQGPGVYPEGSESDGAREVPVGNEVTREEKQPIYPTNTRPEQPPQSLGSIPIQGPTWPQEQFYDRSTQYTQQPGRMTREPRPTATYDVSQQPDSNGVSRRKFLIWGGVALGAVAAAATGTGLAVNGERKKGDHTVVPVPGNTGNTLKQGYRPGNIDPSGILYHPVAGTLQAINGIWQGKDIQIPKLLGPNGFTPNDIATSVLVQMANLISCQQPPDSQVPFYFSDQEPIRTFTGFGFQFRHASLNYTDQLEFYDADTDPVTFAENGADGNGYPIIQLMSGTLYAQRIHGGDWQTQQGRDPRKAQPIKTFQFGYKPSLNYQTISVQSYTFNPPLEDFLEKLRA